MRLNRLHHMQGLQNRAVWNLRVYDKPTIMAVAQSSAFEVRQMISLVMCNLHCLAPRPHLPWRYIEF